ncbi:MAG: C10 family peptidase [Crocinitomicaceae bacterium]|jgi:PKD repeat protein
MNKNIKTVKSNCLILIAFLVPFFNAFAGEVPLERAKLVATNYLLHLTKQTLKRSSTDLLTLGHTYKATSLKRSGTNNLIYVFNRTDGTGFIIVSAEDNVKPILGYSLESNFDESNISPEVAYWLGEYQKQITEVVNSNLINSLEKQQWDLFEANQFSPKRGANVVKPMLKTTWDQGTFYNDSCPYDPTAKKRTYTGCVATAMAQAMKYWSYPSKGTSSKTYTHATYGSLKANFGATTYSWQNMPNSVTSKNTEVARLMFHVGVALSMNYGADGSSAFNSYDSYYQKYPSTHFALQDYFGYDGTKISSVFKKNFTDQGWVDKMKTELDQGRVVIYEGNDGSTTGHCFVLDGYDANNYVHIDWGWSGYYNGYYTFANLVPSGTGSGGGTGNYSSNQGAVIGITPKVSAVPVADFSANVTSTSVGSVVSFTDLSTNYPSSWSWSVSPNNASFVNGTANTSKLPELTFSTPGKYTITLTSTNSKGGNTVSKTTYITVNPVLNKQVCDTLTNFLTAEKKTYVPIKGGGSLAGHISDLNGFAEAYTMNSPFTHVSGVLLDFARAETNNNTSTIKVNLYQNNSGKPGTILSSKTVKISDIKADVANKLETKVIFDSPVAVTGQYFVGFETTNAPGDTVGIYTSSTSGVTTNTAFMRFSTDGYWCSYTTCWSSMKIHLKASPMVAILPSANFTISNSPTVINTNIDLDASTSTNAYAYNWTITGSSVPTSNFYKETVNYSNSGTFNIKLDAIGGCGNTTSITKQIVVNANCTSAPNTPGSITGPSSFCVGQSNVTYSIASVSGATSYIWTLPSGLTGSSTSNTITVTASNTPITGNILVQATNGCGTSEASSFAIVTVQNVTPSFSSVSPICSGTSLSTLPTSSNNSITGTWSPALDNTKTTTYTFTPTSGQCATATTLTITVNSKVTPSFSSVSPICSGASLSALPTLSNNSITGTWSPVLDNTKTTTYTFTPTSGQCATATTLTITVNTKVTPSFTSVIPVCSGTSLNALPTSSNNSITGTWSPALDNTKTTTYTFTPNQGKCATTTTLTITVNSKVTPTFTSVSPICSGSTLSDLPTKSTNNITGSWSPMLDNTKTTTYTFTPTTGQCANQNELTIVVNSLPNPGSIVNVSDMCLGKSLSISSTVQGGVWSLSDNALATIDQNGKLTPTSTGTVSVIYTVTENKCMNQITKSFNINDCASLTNESNEFVSIYPNPVVNELTIKQSSSSFENYTVLDLVGKVILEGKITSKTSTINIQELVPAQYILRMQTSEGQYKQINFTKD